MSAGFVEKQRTGCVVPRQGAFEYGNIVGAQNQAGVLLGGAARNVNQTIVRSNVLTDLRAPAFFQKYERNGRDWPGLATGLCCNALAIYPGA